MAENKKSFILYADQIYTAEELSDEEAGRLYKHLLRYVNDMSPEPPDRITRIAFEPIKQQLKRDLRKYEIIKEKRSTAGKLGGRPINETEAEKAKKANAFNEKQSKAKKAVNVNDTVNDNDNVNNTKKEITPEPPKGDKKTVDESSLNYRAKELFISHFLKLFGNPYYWTAKDAGQMNQLLKKLSFQMKEKARGAEISDNDILSALNVFLNGINDKWINENFSVSVICSKFNEIISQIKSNATKKTIGITTEQGEREFIEAVLNGAGRAEYERNQRLQRQNG